MSESHILADVHYNPYAVFIAHIDSEQYFRARTGLSAFRSASDVFARECSRYYRGLKGYLEWDPVPKNRLSSAIPGGSGGGGNRSRVRGWTDK